MNLTRVGRARRLTARHYDILKGGRGRPLAALVIAMGVV